MRGGFALYVCAQGKDNFERRGFFEPVQEGGNPQFFGADVIEGRNLASQGVVEAVEGARTFQGKDVCGLFDHAKDMRIARGV
ncbi:MAG: hypothetical protein DVB28_001694 [Verrucomicrobia bacterium]|nr:MAG: hypothetical protein DVB28_001694 [Verrucomicrobiota bacterium]